jgi:hypothetical protein
VKRRDPPFTPFALAEPKQATREQLLARGFTEAEVDAAIEHGRVAKVYLNSIYQVSVAPAHVYHEGWPAMLWLSIKRIDRRPIHDWRHLQRIKNAIVGPEHEAVELYPAESRLVDEANQYHLWVLDEAEARFPFGHMQRVVAGPEAAAAVGARQRPFDEEETHAQG